MSTTNKKIWKISEQLNYSDYRHKHGMNVTIELACMPDLHVHNVLSLIMTKLMIKQDKIVYVKCFSILCFVFNAFVEILCIYHSEKYVLTMEIILPWHIIKYKYFIVCIERTIWGNILTTKIDCLLLFFSKTFTSI